MFDEDEPNAVHQADLLYLPHDRVGRRTYKYALTVVDVTSCYKEAEPLSDKTAAEVAAALSRIYKRGPLSWPRLLQVDPGREFMGAVNQLLAKHNVQVHRQQGIVEWFNRTLAERLFRHQYAQEMLLTARGSSEHSSEWVRALPDVVAALNDEVTRLTGKKPKDAIKASAVVHKPSAPASRPVGLEEPLRGLCDPPVPSCISPMSNCCAVPTFPCSSVYFLSHHQRSSTYCKGLLPGALQTQAGVRLLKVFHASQSFLQLSNSTLSSGLTTSSSLLSLKAKYRLSVSIWITLKSPRSMKWSMKSW